MTTKIENPTTYKVQSMILILNNKTVCLAEIQRQIIKVYGEGVITKSMRGNGVGHS